MTTFGGHTIPPLFGGGELGFVLRDAAAISLFINGDGHPNTNIALPVRKIDDILVVFWGEDAGGQPTPTGWTKTIPVAASSNMFTRQATNDASDNFTVPASRTGSMFVQMASFNNPLKNGFVFVNSGSEARGIKGLWLIQPIGAVGDLNTLIIAKAWRENLDTEPGALSETDNLIAEGFETIGKGGSRGGGRIVHGLWSWRNDTGAGIAVPLTDQGFTPAYSQFVVTQSIRFKQIV